MWLSLKADGSDEQAWLKLFKPPFDPRVELLPHESGDQVLILKAVELDDVTTVKSAYNLGDGLVRTLNGLAAAIIGGSSVELDGVAEMPCWQTDPSQEPVRRFKEKRRANLCAQVLRWRAGLV